MRRKAGIAAALIVAGCVGFLVWRDHQRDAALHPAAVTVRAHAGTAVLVPYSRRIEGREEVMGVVEAAIITEPDTLPHGIEKAWTGVWFMSRSAAGELLTWIPESAQGTVEFTLRASGGARTLAGASAGLTAESCRVTLEIGPPREAPAPPRLAGTWSSAEPPMTWTFDADAMTLTTHNDDQTLSFGYRLLPSEAGDWFLVSADAGKRDGYRIAVNEDAIEVSHPGGDRPFATLTR